MFHRDSTCLWQVVHLEVEICSSGPSAADIGVSIERICTVLLFNGNLHLFLFKQGPVSNRRTTTKRGLVTSGWPFSTFSSMPMTIMWLTQIASGLVVWSFWYTEDNQPHNQPLQPRCAPSPSLLPSSAVRCGPIWGAEVAISGKKMQKVNNQTWLVVWAPQFPSSKTRKFCSESPEADWRWCLSHLWSSNSRVWKTSQLRIAQLKFPLQRSLGRNKPCDSSGFRDISRFIDGGRPTVKALPQTPASVAKSQKKTPRLLAATQFGTGIWCSTGQCWRHTHIPSITSCGTSAEWHMACFRFPPEYIKIIQNPWNLWNLENRTRYL